MKEVEFPHKFVVSDNVSCCKKKKKISFESHIRWSYVLQMKYIYCFITIGI